MSALGSTANTSQWTQQIGYMFEINASILPLQTEVIRKKDELDTKIKTLVEKIQNNLLNSPEEVSKEVREIQVLSQALEMQFDQMQQSLEAIQITHYGHTLEKPTWFEGLRPRTKEVADIVRELEAVGAFQNEAAKIRVILGATRKKLQDKSLDSRTHQKEIQEIEALWQQICAEIVKGYSEIQKAFEAMHTIHSPEASGQMSSQ